MFINYAYQNTFVAKRNNLCGGGGVCVCVGGGGRGCRGRGEGRGAGRGVGAGYVGGIAARLNIYLACFYTN